MRRDKLIALLRVRAVRKLLIAAIVAALAALGIAMEPEVADQAITVAALVAEVL